MRLWVYIMGDGKKYKPSYNNCKVLLWQPDKSHFTNCSGQAKQNSLPHLPQLVGNNLF